MGQETWASGGTWQNATYDDYNYQYQWTKTWQGQGDGAVTSSASNHVTGLENGSESGWWTHTMPEGSGSGSSSSTSWGSPWDHSYDTTVSYPGFWEARYYGRDYGGGSGEEDYIAYVGDAFSDPTGSSSGGMLPFAYDDAVYLIAGSELAAGESDGVNIRTHTDPVRSQRSAFLRATVEPGDRSRGTSQSSLQEIPRCRTTQIREHESQPYGPSLRTQATGSEQGTAGQANGPGFWDLYAYYFNQNLDYYQAGLDAAGCIPGAGEPFDALNAGISAARGDWTGAGLSAASMIPMWGDAVGKAGKLGRYAAKYGDEATEAAKRGLKGAAELRPYGGPGGGHHIPARKVFEGAPGYDAKKALALPNEVMKKLGMEHEEITQAQRRLYRELSQTGCDLTWEVVQDIETRALVASGMPQEMAEATVKHAIEALKQAGVSKPTHIPWGGANP